MFSKLRKYADLSFCDLFSFFLLQLSPIVLFVLLMISAVLDLYANLWQLSAAVIFFIVTYFNRRLGYLLAILASPLLAILFDTFAIGEKYLIDACLIGVLFGCCLSDIKSPQEPKSETTAAYLREIIAHPFFLVSMFAIVFAVISFAVEIGELRAFSVAPLDLQKIAESIIKHLFDFDIQSPAFSLTTAVSWYVHICLLVRLANDWRSIAISNKQLIYYLVLAAIPAELTVISVFVLKRSLSFDPAYLSYFGFIIFCCLQLLLAKKNIKQQIFAALIGFLSAVWICFMRFDFFAGLSNLDFTEELKLSFLYPLTGLGFGKATALDLTPSSLVGMVIDLGWISFAIFGLSIILFILRTLKKLRDCIYVSEYILVLLNLVVLIWFVYMMISVGITKQREIAFVFLVWFFAVCYRDNFVKKNNYWKLQKNTILFVLLLAIISGSYTIFKPHSMIRLSSTYASEIDAATGLTSQWNGPIFTNEWNINQCVRFFIKPLAEEGASAIKFGLVNRDNMAESYLPISELVKWESNLIVESKRMLINGEWNAICMCISANAVGKVQQQCPQQQSCLAYIGATHGSYPSWGKSGFLEDDRFVSFATSSFEHVDKEQIYSKKWLLDYNCQDYIYLGK